MLINRLQEEGGFARTSEVTRSSTDRRRLALEIEAGRVVRVARGIVALPQFTQEGAALAHGGAVTCVSALARHRIPLLEEARVLHVAIARNRGTSPSVVQHWTGSGERGVVSLPQALVHAVRCLPGPEWVAAADAAVSRGLDVGELLRLQPRRGAARLERLIMLVDGRSGSLPESLLRVALRSAGLPAEPQVHVPGVGRVDFLVGDVIVEVDGFAYHSDRGQYREDRRRDRAAHLGGYLVLRFTYEDVVYARDMVVSQVRSAFSARSAARAARDMAGSGRLLVARRG